METQKLEKGKMSKNIKEEVTETSASIPSTLSTEATEGKLTIKIMFGDAVQEFADSLGHESPENSIGCMSIEAMMEVGDLKTNDIIGATPEEFLKNGVIAGILDALRVGLNQPRGINFNEAVEKATEKAHDAHRIEHTLSLLEKLQTKVGEAVLEKTPTQGSA